MRGARQRRRSPSSFRTSAPSPRWGWHRLEPAAARRVVEQAAIRRGELVVDLGAGSGVLTDALLAAGARVIAVELHPDRVATLRTRYDGRPVDVIRADVARVRLPTRPFRVVANPPWSVAESIRETLTQSRWLVRADVVLPRWLVRRWAEGDRRITVGCSLRAESFTPHAPAGASVAIVLGPRECVRWSR